MVGVIYAAVNAVANARTEVFMETVTARVTEDLYSRVQVGTRVVVERTVTSCSLDEATDPSYRAEARTPGAALSR